MSWTAPTAEVSIVSVTDFNAGDAVESAIINNEISLERCLAMQVSATFASAPRPQSSIEFRVVPMFENSDGITNRAAFAHQDLWLYSAETTQLIIYPTMMIFPFRFKFMFRNSIGINMPAFDVGYRLYSETK